MQKQDGGKRRILHANLLKLKTWEKFAIFSHFTKPKKSQIGT